MFVSLNCSDYFNSKDLHIGVTDSKGIVVEFDRDGLQRADAHLWKQCLVLDGAAGPWSDHWDSTLFQVARQDCWTSERFVLQISKSILHLFIDV